MTEKSKKEKNNPIIEIFSGTPWEAAMIQSLLENAEIKSFLKNNVIVTYLYDPGLAEGVKVMISSNDFEDAKEIVDEYYNNLGDNT